MSEEQKKSKFRKCYEPHLRDYPDCFEECGCDICEAPLFSQSFEEIEAIKKSIPEPKPCAEKDLPACGLCEYWHEFHPQRSTNAKCLACYEDCKTGKQPTEQPEMKLIDDDIFTPKPFHNKWTDWEIKLLNAQLAADKKVCEECRERQEAEIADLKDEVLFKTLALKANGESQDKMATEIASLKSQLNKQEEL